MVVAIPGLMSNPSCSRNGVWLWLWIITFTPATVDSRAMWSFCSAFRIRESPRNKRKGKPSLNLDFQPQLLTPRLGINIISHTPNIAREVIRVVLSEQSLVQTWLASMPKRMCNPFSVEWSLLGLSSLPLHPTTYHMQRQVLLLPKRDLFRLC